MVTCNNDNNDGITTGSGSDNDAGGDSSGDDYVEQQNETWDILTDLKQVELREKCREWKRKKKRSGSKPKHIDQLLELETPRGAAGKWIGNELPYYIKQIPNTSSQFNYQQCSQWW